MNQLLFANTRQAIAHPYLLLAFVVDGLRARHLLEFETGCTLKQTERGQHSGRSRYSSILPIRPNSNKVETTPFPNECCGVAGSARWRSSDDVLHVRMHAIHYRHIPQTRRPASIDLEIPCPMHALRPTQLDEHFLDSQCPRWQVWSLTAALLDRTILDPPSDALR